jgi:hypothetical protein
MSIWVARVGDIVTRGKSKLPWKITELRPVTAETMMGGGTGLALDTIAYLEPVGEGRYTRASASIDDLWLVTPAEEL